MSKDNAYLADILQAAKAIRRFDLPSLIVKMETYLLAHPPESDQNEVA